MPVVKIDKDVDALTLELVAEFDASVERVWQLWEDPRKLERWWGPPTWPATFETHDFQIGGRANYYMTGPEGEKARGWWQFTAINQHVALELDDGFADDDGTPSTTIEPVHMTVTLEAEGDRTVLTNLTQFVSIEQMNTMVEMGMDEGLREAAGQMDAVLAEVPV